MYVAGHQGGHEMAALTVLGRRVRGERGAIYIGLMFLTAFLAAGTMAVGPLVQISMQREREAELLFIGEEFRRAILTYYEASPGGKKQYPRSLNDLLEDDRYPVARRHLRRVYRDPWSGRSQWGLVEAEDGGIKGIYSLTARTPIKHAGFPARHAVFAKAQSYRDWRFIHEPQSFH